jgi:hypothetical protein
MKMTAAVNRERLLLSYIAVREIGTASTQSLMRIVGIS